MVAALINLGSVFEKLVEDRLLLVVVNVHALALDSAAVGSKRNNHQLYFLICMKLKFFCSLKLYEITY